VILDGAQLTVTLAQDLVDVGTAVSYLQQQLSGATVSEDHGNIAITSSTSGSDSWVETDAGSGAHALELFGDGVAVYGHSAGTDDCHELHATSQGYGSNLPALWENHFYYDMCEPYGYIDYQFEVTHDMADQNLVLEVEDLGSSDNPESLSTYLYFGSIPLDRKTERYKDVSSDGLWTNAISQHDLQEGTYFLSVRCGPELVHYRVLTQLIQAHIADGATVHGEICPGDWVYHYYPYVPEIVGNGTVSDTGGGHGRRLQSHGIDHQNLRFTVKLHSGDLFYLTRHNYPPIKLIPPFRATAAEEQFATGEYTAVELCNVEVGRHYLGLRGGSHCSEYEIEVEVFYDHEGNCTEMEHDTALQTSEEATTVVLDHFMLGSCSPGAYVDFFIHIDPDQESNNMIIEVEALTDDMDPHVLGLYLYEGSIPADRQTERYSESSNDNAYSVGINYHDLRAGDYFVSVRCGDAPMHFRLVAHLVHAEVIEHHPQSGSVCPGQFVYHYFYVREQDVGMDLTWSFELHSGDVYYLTRHVHAPLKLTQPYGHADSEDHVLHHTHSEVQNCALLPGKYYLALRGG
jgi:hypothetical protein